MAGFSTSISNFIFFSSLFLLVSSTTATAIATATTTVTVCNDTPYPSFCQTALQINKSATATASIHDSGRLLIHKSIAAATNFSKMIDKHLTTASGSTVRAIRALQDCRYLAGENVEFLLNTYQIVNSSKTALSSTSSEEAHTMLSAVLTNVDTCLDGLHASAASLFTDNGFMDSIRNDIKLYSVSLSLFNKGWGVKNNRSSKKIGTSKGLKNGRLPPFKMSDETTAIFESMVGGRRKPLQGGAPAGNQVAVRRIVVVSQDGSGNFTTISDAINFAPNNTANSSAGYFKIYVKAGVYKEYVFIPNYKKYLMMIGDGINRTVITGNHNYDDGWNTFDSATFTVMARNFVAMNITIRNTAGPIKHQAVALTNGADLSTFYRCSFEGYQDTLFAHSFRQFYRECDIYGTVDFIFGNAAVVLQKCNIYPRLPIPGQFNTITAQGRTDSGQNTGISIQMCNIRPADDLASGDGTTLTYLGRPWKQYSRTVYMQSYMDTLVNPAGWSVWSGDFALNTSYYAEFENLGSGSDTSRRVTWPGFHVINGVVAINFTASVFIPGNDFLPETGVPYDGGLLLFAGPVITNFN